MHSQATHFAFSFRQEIYRDKAETLLHLQVRQERLQPDLVLPGTNERLDHLLDTAGMALALEKSGENFIYRFFETIDNGKQDEAIMGRRFRHQVDKPEVDGWKIAEIATGP